ncbi:hypothetical protein OESDEN_13062 [Oesophagostomum dentatum]|uniref:Uncharacterized protein n=1 Tax=Oesophagostomum dentatum TaxID=61180 RepID=A0A0B1SPE7_OESDE|nr:hypothetical protein OESDEN_13062 [Oesophagostomum dentatum]
MFSNLTYMRDYNDYDDVTIPPNLTDLLANLPDDLSPETLQKMFRLTPPVGRYFFICTMFETTQVDWMSGRRRDVPPPDDSVRTVRVTRQHPNEEMNNSDKPMISGQLMIFELDEEPPEFEGASRKKLGSTTGTSACAISRAGLFAVAGGLGAVCAALFVAVLTMFLKLNRIDGKPSDCLSYSEKMDKAMVYRPHPRTRS